MRRREPVHRGRSGRAGHKRQFWPTPRVMDDVGGGRRREKEAAGSRQGRWTGPRSAGDGGRDVVEASSRCPSAEEVT